MLRYSKIFACSSAFEMCIRDRDTDGWQALQPFGQTEVLVSVIVPVHNGEKDLRQCLNSILAQECGNTVEIIAVNDNSTDSSGDILEEYANWGEVRLSLIHI